MKALVVVDMQQKYLPYYQENLLDNVNLIIEEAKGQGAPIIYVRNIGKPENKSQYELASGLKMESEFIIEKNHPSAFKSEEFVNKLVEMRITELEIVGIDGSCCVAKTALDAAKRGYTVRLLLSCVGARNEKSFMKQVQLMQEAGVLMIQ